MLVEHFFAVANEEEGTEVRTPTKADIKLMARRCSGMSIRVLGNGVRRLVVVKRRGRAGREDLMQAGLLPAPRCHVDVEARRQGRVRVALEPDDGMPFRAIVAEVGRAVAGAVLGKHGGSVNDAIRSLGISKWLWYRLRSR